MGKVYGYTAQIQAIEVGIKPKEMVDRSRTRNFRALPGIIVASNNISFFKLCQTELDFVAKNLVVASYTISATFLAEKIKSMATMGCTYQTLYLVLSF